MEVPGGYQSKRGQPSALDTPGEHRTVEKWIVGSAPPHNSSKRQTQQQDEIVF